MNMITLQNISRTYLLEDGASLTPVRNIDLTVGRGEFLMLVGRSGSGKTSLLNLAAGLMRPTTGRVFVNGTDIWTLTDRRLASLRADKIGFVFQFPSLVPSLNVLENTLLPASFVSAERLTPVALLVTVTRAPAMTAPEESATVPLISPKV